MYLYCSFFNSIYEQITPMIKILYNGKWLSQDEYDKEKFKEMIESGEVGE